MTNETKHTLGPWRAEHGMIYAGDERVAFIPAPSIGIAQKEANAALIAAAPVLLEACEAAMEWAAAFPLGIASCEPDIEAAADVYRRCRSAIAKAEPSPPR